MMGSPGGMGWDTHLSALGHQTQQIPPLRQAPTCSWGEG
jgi:hypothetical protein